MKQQHYRLRNSLLAIATCVTLSAGYAQVTGHSTTPKVLIGVTGTGYHNPNIGTPAIGLPSVFHGTLFSPTIVTGDQPIGTFTLGEMPPSHRTPGASPDDRITVGAVNNSVYFGEYLAAPTSPGSRNTVFYVGQETTANLPTSTATYQVTGINQYAVDSALLTGTLTASFGGSNKLTGELERAPFDYAVTSTLAIDARIASDGSFSGEAYANRLAEGTTQGHFFGAGAEGLAGIAKFDGNRFLDTAFAGSKN